MSEIKKMIEMEFLDGMSTEEINEVFVALNDENKMLKEIINAKNSISDGDVIELNKFIGTELPNDGSWWNDGNENFEVVSKDLLAKGFTVDEIKETFNSLYSAVSNEFGD